MRIRPLRPSRPQRSQKPKSTTRQTYRSLAAEDSWTSPPAGAAAATAAAARGGQRLLLSGTAADGKDRDQAPCPFVACMAAHRLVSRRHRPKLLKLCLTRRAVILVERHWLANPHQVSIQIILQLLRPGRMAQLAECFGLDLANALARHAELPSDLFQGAAAAVFETESKLQHPALAAG